MKPKRKKPNQPITPEIRHYIAFAVTARYGDLDPRQPALLRRNIRRRSGVFVDEAEILALAQHYKAIYLEAVKILPRALDPDRPATAAYSRSEIARFVALVQ